MSTSQLPGEGAELGDSLESIALAMGESPEEVVDEQEEDQVQDVETAEAEEEAESDQEAEEVEDDDPEIDLGEIKLKKSELKAGYMKDADYRRKTAEAAEAKRAAQAERDAIRKEREDRANHLDAYLHLAHQQLVGDQQYLAKLAQDDPAAWVAEKQAMEVRTQNFQALLQERQALANRMSAEQEREVTEWRKSERDKLHEKLPEWKDPQKAGAEQRMVAEYLIEQGYSQDDLKDLFDHRALIVAREAALWRQHQAALKSAKAKQPPKAAPTETLRPGTAKPAKEVANQSKIQAAQDRLRRNPDSLEALSALVHARGS